MKPDIKVEQGRFVVSSVDVRYATRDLLVLEADCDSKYPGHVSLAWGGPEGPRVDIWGDDERSIGLDESTDLPTTITLPKYVDDWTLVTDARRYTVTIVAYNRKHRKREIWKNT